MAELFPQLRRARVVIAVVMALGLVLAPTAGATGNGLTGWLSAAPRFPARALVLFPPAGAPALLSQIHVSENNRPVRGLSTAQVVAANPGDFGVILAVQTGAGITKQAGLAEGVAVGRVLAERQAGQEVGIVGFDSQPSLVLPMSSDTGNALQRLKKVSGRGSNGGAADPGAAVALAVQTLQRSHLALGGIILLADGAAGTINGSAARTAAIAANVPVITVPIADAHSTATGLRAIAALGDSHTPASGPAQAVAEASLAWATLQRASIVRWRSAETRAGPVRVTAQADGVPGAVTTSYVAPASPHASPSAPAFERTYPSAADLRSALRHSSRLASTPGFSLPAVSPATPTAGAAPATAVAPTSFWHSGSGTLVMALIAGLLIGTAIFLVVHKPESEGVRSRVGVFMPQGPDADEAAAQLNTGRATKMSGLWADFVSNVEVARNPRAPVDLVKRAAVFGVIAAVLMYLLSGFAPLALLPLLGWPLVLRAFVRRAAEKQRKTFRDGVPGYLQDLASAMRVGRSFVGALAVVADGADEPTRSELERVITDEQLGLPLEESLEAVAVRMEAPDMDQVALIAALNRRSGSNVAEALDRVAEGARERADMNREVKALTAQAKMSSYVLTALPGLLLIGISVVSPQYAYPFFHTTMGFVCIGVGALMVFAGWKVMEKIAEVKV